MLKDITNYYELTAASAVTAQKGWDLYNADSFTGSYNGGHYTDPLPDEQGFEFWSNGKYATVDSDSNGHRDTFFVILDEELYYVFCMNGEGITHKGKNCDVLIDVAAPELKPFVSAHLRNEIK